MHGIRTIRCAYIFAIYIIKMPKISSVKGLLLGKSEGPATWASSMILVVVETSDGFVGYGEAVPTLRARPVIESINELSRAMVGRDALEIEANHLEWEKHDFYLHSSFESKTALSAFDIALWDILGKVYGAPVYRLFGGKVREDIEVYANGWYSNCKTPDDFAERAKEVVRMGYRAMKFDPFGPNYNSIDYGGIKRAADIVKAVRESVGDSVKLMIEHHGRFNLSSAMAVAEELAQYNPFFMEEPLHPQSLMGLREYRARVGLKVALGERVTTKEQALEYMSEGLVDYLQPDICNIGGFTEIKKVAAMADAYSVQLAPHNAFGPIQNAATIQFDATVPNFEIQESFYDFFPQWKRDLIYDATKVEGGRYRIPDKPGIGVVVNEKMIDQLKYEGQEEWNPQEPVWVVRGTWG